MQDLINHSASKEIHELKADEFISFEQYISYRIVFDRFLSAGLEVPSDRTGPLDNCVFPVGCKMWRSASPNVDMSVFVLKEINLSEVTVRSQKYPEAQEHLLGRNTRIDHFVELYNDGVEFPPLIGYQHGEEIYLIDGNRRFLAAKKAGILTLKVFAEEIDNEGFTKNRTVFVQEALEKNLQVPQEVQNEIAGYRSGKEMRTVFKYVEKRRNEYPAIGDQLDALHKYLRGDNASIQDIWEKIDAIKASYPKT